MQSAPQSMILVLEPDLVPVTEPPASGLLATVSMTGVGMVRETLAAELEPLTLTAFTVQSYVDPAVRPVSVADVPVTETMIVPPRETV